MDPFHDDGNTTSVILELTLRKSQQELTQGADGNAAAVDVLVNFLKGAGRCFYLVSPSETSFSSPDQVPNYFRQAWPYFVLLIVAENILLWFERHSEDHQHDENGNQTAKVKPRDLNTGPQASAGARLNDSITSISHGLMQECGRLLCRGAEGATYVWIHERFHLVDLPWDHPATWYIAALAVDFGYYWVHRASHEVHILWAQHQVHHSSEEFNLTVGLRQSAMQGWCGFVFYLPLALVIPPSHFLAHQHFSVMYQFWIHTKSIKSLGPLEWVLNTPKHHRIHHGSNIYCLDKNYGGFLIIWDRLFGTFAEEKPDEEIVYGLVYNQPSFNPLHLQWFYTSYVVQRFRSSTNWPHRLASLFYGPSWAPGSPRLGREEDKVHVVPRPKYDVTLPTLVNVYLAAHFALVLYGFQELSLRHMTMSPSAVFIWVIYILMSVTSIGLMLDGARFGSVLECVRCFLLASWLHQPVLRTVFLVSCALWAAHTCRTKTTRAGDRVKIL